MIGFMLAVIGVWIRLSGRDGWYRALVVRDEASDVGRRWTEHTANSSRLLDCRQPSSTETSHEISSPDRRGGDEEA
jgi:hypothetical protein